MTKVSQKQQVREILTSGKSLTSAQASSKYGIANLRARITELSKEGVSIVRTPVVKNGVRIVEYSLSSKAPRKATRARKTAVSSNASRPRAKVAPKAKARVS